MPELLCGERGGGGALAAVLCGGQRVAQSGDVAFCFGVLGECASELHGELPLGPWRVRVRLTHEVHDVTSTGTFYVASTGTVNT